jgi:hypothetical protein
MDENKKQTVLAFVRLACTLVTTGLAMYGITVDANAIFVGAMLVLALIAYVWSWWKNNNVSTAATEAQKVLDELKNGVGVEIIDDDFGDK